MMDCPMCDTPLEQSIEYSDFDKLVIEEYPYVLAYPYKRMLEETEGRNKLELLAYTFLNGLKLLSLELASEYFQSNLKSAKLNELFRNNLFQPSFGNWNAFLREAIAVFESEKHPLIFPEFAAAYKSIELDKKAQKYKTESPYTNEEGRTAWKKSELTAIGTLINFRNRYLGHGVPLSKDEYTSLYKEIHPVFTDFMKALEYTCALQLTKNDADGEYLLKGCTLVLNETKQSRKVTEDANITLKAGDGRVLHLLPFYILPKQHISDADDRAEILVYEQSTGQRIIFYSPESIKAEESGQVLESLRILLSDKEMEEPCSLQDFSHDYVLKWIKIHNDKVLEGLYKEKKVIPGVYQQRLEAETALLSWIGAKVSLFIMAAEAGSGKTNILTHLLSLYERAGLDSILIRSNRCGSVSLEAELRKILNAPTELDLAQYLNKTYDQLNPLMIIIDGGNEHQQPQGFVDGILTFLSQITPGYVKVVLSWRISTLNDIPEIDSHHDNLIYTAAENEHHALLAKKAYRLFGMNKIELEGAWNAYTKSVTGLYKLKFNFDELFLTDAKLIEELSNPLLLRLFLELHHQKPIPKKDKGFVNLWSVWWTTMLQEPSQATFLQSLAAYMIDQQRLSVTLDELFDHPELGNAVKNIQIDSPYRQLVQKGVLSQYFKEDAIYVAFTMEAAMYYIASLRLSESMIRTKINEHTIWIEPTRFYLWDQAHRSNSSILFVLIDEGKLPCSLVSFGLTQYVFMHGLSSALDQLFMNPSGSDWEILDASFQLIREIRPNESTSIADQILTFVRGKMTDVNKRLVLKLLSEGSKTVVDQIIQEHFEDYKPENVEEAVALARYFEKIGQSKKAYDFLVVYLEDNATITRDTIELFKIFVDICKELGRYKEAWDTIDRWEAELKQHFGLSTKDRALILTRRGSVKEYLGLFAEASEYYSEALRINEELLGPYHGDTLNSISDIGDIKREKGQCDEALQHYELNLERNSKLYDESHPMLAATLTRIGGIYNTKGQYDIALECFEKALNIYVETYGESHPDVAALLYRIGGIYETKGQYNKALEYFEKALTTYIQYYGESHPNVAATLNSIGDIYVTIGQYDKALEYFEKDLVISTEYYGETHPNVAATLNHIGVLFISKRLYDKAVEYLNRALEIDVQYFGSEHRNTAAIKRNLAHALILSGRFDEGEPILLDAIRTLEANTIESDPLLARCFLRYALLHRLQKQSEQALTQVDKSISLFEERFGKDSVEAADAYFEKGMIYYSSNDKDSAHDWFTKCSQIRLNRLGVEHPDSISVQNYLNDIRI